EGLGRRDLVHQVEVDIKNCRLPWLFVYYVGIPNLFDHSLGHCRFTSPENLTLVSYYRGFVSTHESPFPAARGPPPGEPGGALTALPNHESPESHPNLTEVSFIVSLEVEFR